MTGGPHLLDPRRDMHFRVPPVYNPETDRTYPFRTFTRDVGIWCVMTDLNPMQQRIAIIARLQGQARETADTLTPQEVAAGVERNGERIDPVLLLMGLLAQRFDPFDDEARNEAMVATWTLKRKPGEQIDVPIPRFEALRQRAVKEGHYNMSVHRGMGIYALKGVPFVTYTADSVS